MIRSPRRRLSILQRFRRRQPIGIGPSRAAVKRARDAAERAQKARIRARCVVRDGYCRYARDVAGPATPCVGPSEWAHFDAHRRARTRGQVPEVRHTTAGSLMLCRGHHRAYDHGRLRITARDPRRGCRGRLRYAVSGRV